MCTHTHRHAHTVFTECATQTNTKPFLVLNVRSLAGGVPAGRSQSDDQIRIRGFRGPGAPGVCVVVCVVCVAVQGTGFPSGTCHW